MPQRTFEQWVNGIFDHPVKKKEWFWENDADHCVEEDADDNVRYITRLFFQSDLVLSRFSNAQVKQGLNLIVNMACDAHVWTIVLPTAQWELRRECIRSIYDLNAKCFAARCENLVNPSKSGNPLNSICFMWWDVFPVHGRPEDPERAEEDAEYPSVMERCLTLTHDACLQGALHGLGHWQHHYPERIEKIVRDFLRNRDDLKPELVVYARRAMEGNVQ